MSKTLDIMKSKLTELEATAQHDGYVGKFGEFKFGKLLDNFDEWFFTLQAVQGLESGALTDADVLIGKIRGYRLDD